MASRTTELWLHEEVLLLSLRDEKGNVDGRASLYTYALAGGAISELLLAGRLTITDARKQLLEVADPRPLNEPLLDEVLGRISSARRRERMQTWVMRVAHTRNLRHRVAAGLCERGVLRETEAQVLLLFRVRRYPEQDPRCERAIRARLTEAVLSERGACTPRTATLLALLEAGQLLGLVFSREELRRGRERLSQITRGQLMGRGTKGAVEAAQAAACAATTAALVATMSD